MESEKAVAVEEACRFCWMCRHLCPVALVTGSEANTPRGRALVLSMDRRGTPYGKESAKWMFQCALCYACADNCATGYDPTIFTREARSRALAEGLAGKAETELAEALLEGKNPLVHEKPDAAYRSLTEHLPKKAKVLVYRSGYTKSAAPLLSILSRSSVDYTTYADEPVSGALACDVAGYMEEVKQLAQKWAAWVEQSGAETVVCLNPGDVFFIRDQMAKWDIPVKASVVTATSYVASLAKRGAFVPEKKKGTMVYHDPSRLSRNLMETEDARSLLNLSGVETKELFLHGHLSRSAGSVVLLELFPELEKKVSAGFWEDVARTGVKSVVTASPETLACLRSALPDGMKAIDLFSLL